MHAGDVPLLVHNCDSRKLGRALERSGEARPDDVMQAHHIIPCGCKKVKQAWKVLQKHNIDIDSEVNGVWMSHQGHRGTFVHSYYRYINDEVLAADARGGRQAVLDFLSKTKEELAAVDQYARYEVYGGL
ncbi:AHH domain-containing protein [Streptomyces sp. NPDC052682]|uniref:AHH domain-containing protein n=1 Tax=Streptomyces sp. NPDC052682 TaxID=3154954 RepID=UPI0034288EE6